MYLSYTQLFLTAIFCFSLDFSGEVIKYVWTEKYFFCFLIDAAFLVSSWTRLLVGMLHLYFKVGHTFDGKLRFIFHLSTTVSLFFTKKYAKKGKKFYRKGFRFRA